ncbi:hypothetical protein GCM10008090_24590 [Arenicella chitinivorans]|uniref:Uncharacterized protein n=1 Tax=Arenicella chitinivorans TaxID=1329800 RepID=A0A918VMV8_9GAMM|nr:hypothetical protein GCM10008090_24590 [Arenicella chitinivorans]
MKIEIAGPVFKCAEDEKVFFSRVCSLPGYDSVVGKGRNLCILLKSSREGSVCDELSDICDMWNTTYRVLEI